MSFVLSSFQRQLSACWELVWELYYLFRFTRVVFLNFAINIVNYSIPHRLTTTYSIFIIFHQHNQVDCSFWWNCSYSTSRAVHISFQYVVCTCVFVIWHELSCTSLLLLLSFSLCLVDEVHRVLCFISLSWISEPRDEIFLFLISIYEKVFLNLVLVVL